MTVGWKFKDEWAAAHPGDDKARVAAALDVRLKEVAEAALPPDLASGAVTVLQAPIVLEILKTTNVAAPTGKPASKHAPRMLKLQFTDGHTKCFGIELSPLSSVSLNTPPGTKVLLQTDTRVRRGLLLLTETSLRCLGGRVPDMVQRWEIQKQFAGGVGRARAKSDAPSFTAMVKGGASAKAAIAAAHCSIVGIPKDEEGASSADAET
eukprot:gene29838-21651_t